MKIQKSPKKQSIIVTSRRLVFLLNLYILGVPPQVSGLSLEFMKKVFMQAYVGPLVRRTKIFLNTQGVQQKFGISKLYI